MTASVTRKFYLIFLVLLPCVFVPKYIIDPVLIPRELALSFFVIGLFSLGVFSVKKIDSSVIKNPFFIAISCFLVATLISSFTVGFNSENHAFLSKWIISSCFFVGTTLLLYTHKINQKTLFTGLSLMMAVALLGAYWDIAKIIIHHEPLFKKTTEIKSFFGNKNLLASALFLCLPFLLMKIKNQSKRWSVYTIILLFSIPIFLVTQTRAVWLALLVFTISFVGLNSKMKLKIILPMLIVLLLCIVAVVNYVAPIVRDKTSNQEISRFWINAANPNTIKARNVYWEHAWKMFREQPVFGVGPGNFQKFFPKYGIQKLGYEMANGTQTLQRVHNDFLSVLCEIGWMGFLPFMALWMIALVKSYRLMNLSQTAYQRMNYVFILSGLLGFMVIAFLDFPLERTEHQIVFFCFLACLFADDLKSKNNSKPFLIKPPIKLMAFAGIIYATSVGFFRLYGEINAVKMYNAKAEQQWSDVIYYSQKARSNFYQIDATGIPIEWYQGMACFAQGDTDQSKKCFEEAYAAAPYQIQVIHNLGAVYEQQKKWNESKKYYQKALEIAPNFEEALISLAGVYYKTGNYHKAFETIDIVDIKTKNKRYRPYLTRILIREMNAVLSQINQPDLAQFMAQQMTNSEKINNFYWMGKSLKLNLKTYILQQRRSNEFYWFELLLKSKHK